MANDPVPPLLNYQSRIQVDEVPFNGTAQLKFALVGSDNTNVWTNDGSQIGSDGGTEPTAPTADVLVEAGLFHYLIGSQTPLTPELFQDSALSVRVWINTGTGFVALPERRLVSVGYAMSAGAAGTANSVATNTVGTEEIVDGSISVDDLGQTVTDLINENNQDNTALWNNKTVLTDVEAVLSQQTTLFTYGLTEGNVNTLATGGLAASMRGMIYDDSNGAFRVGSSSKFLGAGTPISVPASLWVIDDFGTDSVAFGKANVATGDQSFVVGDENSASGKGSIATGFLTISEGENSTTFGTETTASGRDSFSLGFNSTASGSRSVAFGLNSTASNVGSVATGSGTTASGPSSTTFGLGTTASGDRSFAIGQTTTASFANSFAGGQNAQANNNNTFAFGTRVVASGSSSSAFGVDNTASGSGSFAVGEFTTATGAYSLASGKTNESTGEASFTTGLLNEAEGDYSFASGSSNVATGERSFVAGIGNIANNPDEFLVGKYNAIDALGGVARVFGVGWGSGTTLDVRRTALEVLSNGETKIRDLTVIDFSNISDERHKNNIESMADVYEKILRMRGVSFHWNENSQFISNRGIDASKINIGFIAQEVQKEFPEIVSEDENTGYLSVNYLAFTAILTEGFKEQDAIIKSQAVTITNQAAQIADLQQQLQQQQSTLNEIVARLDQIDNQLPSPEPVRSDHQVSAPGSRTAVLAISHQP